jgi:serine/threonine protein kinase
MDASMPEATIYCTSCGTDNHAQASFCFYCGSVLNQETSNDSTVLSSSGGVCAQMVTSTFVANTDDLSTEIATAAPHPNIDEISSGNVIARADGISGMSVTATTLSDSMAVAGTSRLVIGRCLHERYQIISLLGQGGMEAVYKAEDMTLGKRLVAIKEMSMASLYPEEVTGAAAMFEQEALMLAKLQHPNLPSIHDHFSEAGRWYLVMSFIEGASLEHVLQKSSGEQLPVSEVLKIGMTLCGVLDYLHTQQPPIIFRDLKPSNIMQTPRGDIYLIDFGIARHFKLGKAKDTMNYCTPGYAPPEQYGEAQTTPRSDVYSLGATLHRLLSGYNPSRSPFLFPTLRSLGIAVPDDLELLILSMVALEPNQRPANMQVVKQHLQRLTDSAIVPTIQAQPQSQAWELDGNVGPIFAHQSFGMHPSYVQSQPPVPPPPPFAQSQSLVPPPPPYAQSRSLVSPRQYAPPSLPSTPATPARRWLSFGKIVLLTLGTIIGFIILLFGAILVGMSFPCVPDAMLDNIVVGIPMFIVGLFLIRKCVPTMLGRWLGGLGGLVGMLLIITVLIHQDMIQAIGGVITFLASALVFLVTHFRKKYP